MGKTDIDLWAGRWEVWTRGNRLVEQLQEHQRQVASMIQQLQIEASEQGDKDGEERESTTHGSVDGDCRRTDLSVRLPRHILRPVRARRRYWADV